MTLDLSMFAKNKKKVTSSGLDTSMFDVKQPEPVKREPINVPPIRKPLTPKSEGLGFSGAIKTDIFPQFRQKQAEEAVTSEV